MLALKDVLHNRTCRMLKATARAHRLKFDNRPRKTVQIETLHQHMVEKQSLWRAFRQLEQADIEALHALHANDNHLPLWTFTRAFGDIRPYKPWRDDTPRYPWKKPVSPAEKLYYMGLIEVVGDEVWMPVEVLEFLPPLPYLQPRMHTIHETLSPDLLRIDVAVLLGVLLYEDVRLMWGRWLPPTIIKTLQIRLYGECDAGHSELQSGRIRLLHYLAEVAGLVAVQNGLLKPTVQAWQWLNESPAKQWQILWGAWQADLQNHRSHWEIYRFPTITRGVWQPLFAKLAQLAAHTCYDTQSFVESLRPYVPGQDLSNVAGILAGPLSWAGLVTSVEGDMQLTGMGKAVLTGRYLAPHVDEHARLKLDHKRINVYLPPNPSLHPLVELLSFASRDASGLWVDETAVRKAVGQGYSAAMVVEVLARLCGEALPVTVLVKVEDWARHAQQLVVRQMTVLTSPDSQCLANIRADRHLRSMIAEPLSAHHLAIEPHQVQSLCQRLRKRGLPVTETPEAKGELTPAMLEYCWLAVKIVQGMQGEVDSPVRVPGAVLDWLAGQVAETSYLESAAQDVVEQFTRSREGYAMTPSPVSEEDPAKIRAAITDAFETRSAITIDYFSPAHGKITRRTIEPILPIAEHHGAEYIEAWCQLDDAPRTFRLDRVVEIISNDPL